MSVPRLGLAAAVALAVIAASASLACGGGSDDTATHDAVSTAAPTTRPSRARTPRVRPTSTVSAESTVVTPVDALRTPEPATPVPPPAGGVGGASTVSIRVLDLRATPSIQRLLSETGGEYVQTSVIYADLTGDGAEEAVVPISSGGTAGDIAWAVLTVLEGDVAMLRESEPGGGVPDLHVRVDGTRLVETRPVFGADDPHCCPGELRTTTYAWDGAAFAVESTSVSVLGGSFKPTPLPEP